MAEVLRYVDPDVVGGEGDGTSWEDAYASLNAWEAAEETDLDTANNTHRVLCRSLSGSNDQLICTIAGWTTSVTDYITIEGYDFPTNGIWDDAKYIIENNDDQSSAIYIQEDYVNVRKLQVLVTCGPDNNRYGILINVIAESNYYEIDSCIIKGVCSGTGNAYGIYTADADTIANIYNTVAYGFLSGADTGFFAMFIGGTTVNIYNCTVSGNYTGIYRSTGTVTAINCAVFDNVDDFGGTITVDYCATDEHAGGGTNGVDISGTWNTTCFTNPEATPPDFSVQDADSPVYQTGNGATPKGVFTDDIINTTRDAVDLNWDIGAFEYEGTPPAGIPILRRRRECA